MKRSVLLALAIAVLAAPLAAGEVVKTPQQYLIPKASAPKQIDGKLDDWNMKTPFVISATGDHPHKTTFIGVDNPLKGAADLSGQIALAWDEKFFYLAGQIRDDHLLGVRPNSLGNQGPPGWGCDSVMVQIASFRQTMRGTSPTNPGHPQVALRYAPTGKSPRGRLVGSERILDARDVNWKLTPNSRWASAETPDGYNVEAAIPWADLDFFAGPGEKLYVGILVPDKDPGERLTQIGWGFNKDVRLRPLCRLADRPDVLGLVTTSLDVLPADRALSVRLELDAVKGPARVAEVRVIGSDGQAAFTKAVGLNVPEGKTGVATVEVPKGTIRQPGRYTVALLGSTGGGKADVVASALVTVTGPAADKAGVRAPAGEYRRSSPARWVWSAIDEHKRGYFKHGFVTGTDGYAPYIRKWIAPRLADGLERARKHRQVHDYSLPLAALAMARITKDPAYEKMARELADGLLDYLHTRFKHDDLYLVAAYRLLTWKKDPNSPFAPKDAEKRYRDVLHRLAAKPATMFFGEWGGDHNRIWHRYVPLKVARMVAEEDGKPVDPKVVEYTDYHDFLLKLGDANDASTNYHWVFWRKAMAYYLHTGDLGALARHKNFMRTIFRYVETVSPSGAAAQYGDSGGWPSISGSLWSYEMISTASRDGRFRWTAHRIAEYIYNHMYERSDTTSRGFEFNRINFLLGYLLGDDTVKPVPPSTASRVTWRHPSVPIPLERRRTKPGFPKRNVDPKRWVPDKLILTSGNDPQGLWGMVDLLPIGGHTGELPGNFIVLMQQDAALLAGQGYNDESPELNNVMWIEDLDGLARDAREVVTDVPVLADDRAVTFARVRTKRYRHLPVTWTRDVLFFKKGAVVIKDRVTFETGMKVRLGPGFQTRCLGPQSGPNWFNTYYDELLSGSAFGNLGPVHVIRNPAWDLLVYFGDRPHAGYQVMDRFDVAPTRNSPVGVRQHWSGMARPGQTVTFTTVLLPHKPTPTPGDLLAPPEGSRLPKMLQVLADRDDLTVVQVGHNLRVSRRSGVTWQDTYLVMNDTGKPVQVGPLTTDARVAVVTVDSTGKVLDRVMVDGKRLRYNNSDQSDKARRVAGRPVTLPASFKN